METTVVQETPDIGMLTLLAALLMAVLTFFYICSSRFHVEPTPIQIDRVAESSFIQDSTLWKNW